MLGETEVKKTGIYMEFVDFNELFNGLTFTPVIVNDFDISSPEGAERLNDLIYTRYEGDSLNVTPICECGATHGGGNLHVICDICHFECNVPTDKPLNSVLWLRAPTGIRALVNPHMWTMLSEQLTTSKFNILEWVTNPLYKSDAKEPSELQLLIKGMDHAGLVRGYNSFIDNFDTFMQLFYDLRVILPIMRKELEPLLRENRHKIFCEYMPVPSKITFVIESSRGTSYYDKSIPAAVDAIRTIASIEQGVRPSKGVRREAKVVQAMVKLAEYYYSFFKDIAGGKTGLFRQHIFGSKISFSARAVITSIAGPSNYDELHMPWALSLQLFRLHLINKLWSPPYNLSPIQIERLLKESAFKYNPVIHEILNKLIEESPLKRIPAVFQRNPTLRPGSGQLLYITQFKTDPDIISISLSNNVLAAPTADFDGDEMNLFLVLEERIYRELLNLEPHQYAYDLNRPFQIAGFLALPGPMVATLNNWYQRRQ